MSDVEVVAAAGEVGLAGQLRPEEVGDGDLGVIRGDDERVREDGDARAAGVVEHTERQHGLDALGHVDEGAVLEERLVQRGELGGAQLGGLREQVRLHEVGVLEQRVLQRVEDDAVSCARGVERLVRHKPVVGEDEVARAGDAELAVLHLVEADGRGQIEAVERERRKVGEAPALVGAPGHRQRREALVGGALAVEPPRGEVRHALEMRGEGLAGERAGQIGGSSNGRHLDRLF